MNKLNKIAAALFHASVHGSKENSMTLEQMMEAWKERKEEGNFERWIDLAQKVERWIEEES